MRTFFRNNIQKKILSYLFTHEGMQFYVRELSQYIGEDPGNVSRMIAILHKDGLIHTRIRGKTKYSEINAHHPLYQELKNIIFKTDGVISALCELVEQYEGITFACIYGSFAKQTMSHESDIDVLIVGTVSRETFISSVRALESRVGREIHVAFYTQEEFAAQRSIPGSFVAILVAGTYITLKEPVNAQHHQ